MGHTSCLPGTGPLPYTRNFYRTKVYDRCSLPVREAHSSFCNEPLHRHCVHREGKVPCPMMQQDRSAQDRQYSCLMSTTQMPTRPTGSQDALHADHPSPTSPGFQGGEHLEKRTLTERARLQSSHQASSVQAQTRLFLPKPVPYSRSMPTALPQKQKQIVIFSLLFIVDFRFRNRQSQGHRGAEHRYSVFIPGNLLHTRRSVIQTVLSGIGISLIYYICIVFRGVVEK